MYNPVKSLSDDFDKYSRTILANLLKRLSAVIDLDIDVRIQPAIWQILQIFRLINIM